MPVLKCSNGNYRIGSGKCMYKTKTDALKAYAAYLAISNSEAMIHYVRFVVDSIKKIAKEDTTAGDIAVFIRKIRAVRRRKFFGDKESSK